MLPNIILLDEHGNRMNRTLRNKEYPLSKKYLNLFKKNQDRKPKVVTPRARKVIKWCVKGKTVEEIASFLECSTSNVYTILRKFDLKTKDMRGEAVFVEMVCPTCDKPFNFRKSKMGNQKKFYCSKWCSRNKNLDIKTGKYRCHYCNLLVSPDKMSANSPRTRCLKCENIRVRGLYPRYKDKIVGRNKQKDAKNPERRFAWTELNKAINRGDIIKKPCQECNSTVHVHGHHDDYSKPLEVIWLCPLHHRRHHKLLKGKGINP